ncbi:caspase family protein [Streptomyces sp. NPDC012421]|uniref:caspase family protein n=1 Tax=Streptomyces sp. NPDC012421 TaxID=3364832 RepID=UPI0036E3F6A5
MAPADPPPTSQDEEPSTRAPRRFLIATAVPRVAAHPSLDRPELVDDVQRVEELFLGELGYEKAAPTGPDPTKEQLLKALRSFAMDGDRHPDDYVVLYVAAHGTVAPQSGRHYLLTADSDVADLRGTALPTEELVEHLWEDTPLSRLLVLLDACHAEEGMDAALRRALEARQFRGASGRSPGTGLVLIASSRRKQETAAGALSAAFVRAVRDRATADAAPAHISLDVVMNAIGHDPAVPRWQEPTMSLIHSTSGTPLFLPNPRHIPGAAGHRLDEIDHMLRLRAGERRAREQELVSHFLPRARGGDVNTTEAWDFTGRHAALRDLTAWLGSTDLDDRLCVVTGDPGSGKSSVLGMITLLTDPRRRAAVPRGSLPADGIPDSGAVHTAIHASHKSTRQILDALGAAAGAPAESTGALITALQRRTTPLAVLLDALDEALAPREVLDEVLLPLLDPQLALPVRLLVGARPHIAEVLPHTGRRVDLDDNRYADPAAVRDYTHRLLKADGSTLREAPAELVGAVADAVAEAAGRSFLVARITARTLARETPPPDPHDTLWRAGLPRLPGEAMERDLRQRLGPEVSRARDLLLPLAFAQGGGLPWAGVWPRAAAALADRPYGSEDIVWLREAAGSYVVESEEDGGSVYRVYHRALIEHLREGQDLERVQHTLTQVLREIEHPYTRHYLALHAAEGGALDELVHDSAFVLGSDPVQLLASLPGLRTARGRIAGQAIKDIEEELRARSGRGADAEGRARLRIAAVCRRADALADSCDLAGPLPWRARWAAWNPHEGSRSYPGLSASEGVVVSAGAPSGGTAGDGHEPLFLGIWDRADVVGGWNLRTGAGERIRHLNFTAWPATFTAAPQLGPLAAVITDDFSDLGSITVPFLGRELPRKRLLHLVAGDDPAVRDVWRLPAHPVLDKEAAFRGFHPPRQIALTGGEHRFAALLHFGEVVVHALTRDVDVPDASRRAYRRATAAATGRFRRLREQYAAPIHATIGSGRSIGGPDSGATDVDYLTIAEVTCLTAPQGLAPGALLMGHDTGQYTLYETTTRHAATWSTVHTDALTALAVVHPHPLGRLLVSADRAGAVHLTVLDTGVHVRRLLDRDVAVRDVTVHRVGGQWLAAAATADGLLHRIDVDSGRPVGRSQRIGAGEDLRLASFDLRHTPCVSVQDRSRGLQLYDFVTGERVGGQQARHEVTGLAVTSGSAWVAGSDGVVRYWPSPHSAHSTRFDAHDGPVLAAGSIRGPAGSDELVTVGEDHVIRCWSAAPGEEPRPLWQHTIPREDPWEEPLVGCATVGHTSDGLDLVVTGEHGGRVRVLLLRSGVPVGEQRFTLRAREGESVASTLVTAVATGRVRDRDVVVACTGTGSLYCWDVTHGRWYARVDDVAAQDRRSWTGVLALDPAGTGRVATGREDGTVTEWSLPSGRLLRSVPRAHRAAVTALTYLRRADGSRLIGAGGDLRVVDHTGGWEQRVPRLVSLLRPHDTGALCGDTAGDAWRLSPVAGGWELAPLLDSVRSVTSVVFAPGCSGPDSRSRQDWRDRSRGEGGRSAAHRESGPGGYGVVVAASEDGALDVRDAADGRQLQRLRQLCDSGVASLALPIGRSSGNRPVLTAVSRWRMEDTWEYGPSGWGNRSNRPVPRSAEPTWEVEVLGRHLAVGVRSDLQRLLVAAREVAGAPPMEPLTAPAPLRYWEEDDLLRVVDVRSGQYLPGLKMKSARAVLPVADGRDTGLLIVRDHVAARFAVAPAPGRRLRAVTEYPLPLRARHATLLPPERALVISDGRELAVLDAYNGKVHRRLELDTTISDLAASPAGELVLATRNGLLLFDAPVPATRPPASRASTGSA